jgi:hypothetical protein
MIDRAPQIHKLAGDADDHFVEMPATTWSRTASPLSPSNRRREFDRPTANALVGHVEPTLGKRFLNIAIAQGKAQVGAKLRAEVRRAGNDADDRRLLPYPHPGPNPIRSNRRFS